MPTVTNAPTPPSAPADGDLWFNTGSGREYVWYISPSLIGQWVQTQPSGGGVATPAAPPTPAPLVPSVGPNDVTRVPTQTISQVPPTGPLPGDLWWNSLTGQEFIYYDDGTTQQWVLANRGSGEKGDKGDPGTNSPPVGPAGGDLTGTYPNPILDVLDHPVIVQSDNPDPYTTPQFKAVGSNASISLQGTDDNGSYVEFFVNGEYAGLVAAWFDGTQRLSMWETVAGGFNHYEDGRFVLNVGASSVPNGGLTVCYDNNPATLAPAHFGSVDVESLAILDPRSATAPLAILSAWNSPSPGGWHGDATLVGYSDYIEGFGGIFGSGIEVGAARGTPDAPLALQMGDIAAWFQTLNYNGAQWVYGPQLSFTVDGPASGSTLPVAVALDMFEVGGPANDYQAWKAQSDGWTFFGRGGAIVIEPAGYVRVRGGGLDKASFGVSFDDNLGGIWFEDLRNATKQAQIWMQGEDANGWSIYNYGPASTNPSPYRNWLLFGTTGVLVGFEPTGVLHATTPDAGAIGTEAATAAWVLAKGYSVGGGSPTGAAGGHLTGTYPNPTINPVIDLVVATLRIQRDWPTFQLYDPANPSGQRLFDLTMTDDGKLNFRALSDDGSTVQSTYEFYRNGLLSTATFNSTNSDFRFNGVPVVCQPIAGFLGLANPADGLINGYLGGVGDKTNYWRNDVHRFQSLNGATDFLTVDSAQITAYLPYAIIRPSVPQLSFWSTGNAANQKRNDFYIENDGSFKVRALNDAGATLAAWSFTRDGMLWGLVSPPGVANDTSYATTAWVRALIAAGASISVGIAPPGSPAANALWWNSDASAGGGQLYIYYNDGSTTQWVPAAASAASSGVLGSAFTTDATLRTIDPAVGLIPTDDTIPQVGEGLQIMSLTYTPKSATSRLKLRASITGVSGASAAATMAIFRDGAANAVASTLTVIQTASWLANMYLEREVASGSVAPTTFTVRIGVGSAGQGFYLNGSAGARIHGGAGAATFSIEEHA